VSHLLQHPFRLPCEGRAFYLAALRIEGRQPRDVDRLARHDDWIDRSLAAAFEPGRYRLDADRCAFHLVLRMSDGICRRGLGTCRGEVFHVAFDGRLFLFVGDKVV